MNQQPGLRMQAKLEARVRLKKRIFPCILATLTYVLPMMALGVITTPNLDDTPQRILLLSAVSIAGEVILFGPLVFGLMRFFLHCSRDETVGFSVLFAPYASVKELLRGIRMLLCLIFRTMLWLLIPATLYVGGAYLIARYADLSTLEAYYGYFMTVTGLFLLLCLPVYAKMTAYLSGYVTMCDHPEVGAWQATKIGAACFRGRFADLVLLCLSLVPWLFLGMFTYGVGTLIGIPYFLITLFRMVDRLQQAQDSNDSGPAPEESPLH